MENNPLQCPKTQQQQEQKRKIAQSAIGSGKTSPFRDCLSPRAPAVIGARGWRFSSGHCAVELWKNSLPWAAHFSHPYRTPLRLACQYLCLYCIWHIDLNNEFEFFPFWYIYRICSGSGQSQGKFVLFLLLGARPVFLAEATPRYSSRLGMCWPQFIHLWTRWTSDYWPTARSSSPLLSDAAAAAADGIYIAF